jgi:HSP20 family protein
MSLMRRNPYDPFEDFDQIMNRMLNRMRSLMDTSLVPYERGLMQREDANMLAVDMSSDDKHVVVRTALPGFSEDEVDVNVQGNVLTISAESKIEHEDQQENWHIREMRYGKFARSIVLPEEVATDKADASLENGILTVKLPKQRPNPVQKIVVKAKNLLKGGKKQES